MACPLQSLSSTNTAMLAVHIPGQNSAIVTWLSASLCGPSHLVRSQQKCAYARLPTVNEETWLGSSLLAWLGR